MNEKTKHPRLKSYSLLGLTMIIVVIPFCLYYLYFVTSQSAYFSKRNFRVLAEIGGHISTKIQGLATSLEFVTKKADEKTKVVGDVTLVVGKGTFVVSSADSTPQAKDDKIRIRRESKSKIKQVDRGQAAGLLEDVQKAARLVPDFEHFQYQHLNTARPNECDASSSTNNPSLPPSNTKAVSRGATTEEQRRAAAATSSATGSEPVGLSVNAEKGSFWLSLELKSASCALPGSFSVKSDLNKLLDRFVSRYVIDEQKDTHERLFDEVLVAEQGTGRVIFEQGPAGLSVITLDSLLNNKGAKLELKLADQSSTLTDVRIAGADYKLFLQPVRLALSASSDEDKMGVRWVVCGLTRTDHFRDETFAVSYTVLIIFVFAVLLAALSWPLLKLKLMGPKDKLRPVDFGLTLFSALMGTALVTFILLDLHTYLGLNDALDDSLVSLSEKIKSNFKKELTNALEQLKVLNAKVVTVSPPGDGATNNANKGKSPDEKLAGSGTPSFFWRPDILTNYLDWKTAPYPYFNNATWTDPTGQQKIKYTTRSDPTTFISVSKRQFFNDARDNNTWRLEQSNGTGFEYSFELLNSRITGENLAIVATRASPSQWVSNLDTQLISLMGAVLPAGYGFAVLDSSGKVIFHSDEVKNLEEQFFAECEYDSWLRAAVTSRTDRLLDANYLGKGHHMYVSPLADTPWTVVSFVDKRMARTINLEVITLSFILYLLFGLLIFAVISLGCLLRMIPVFSGRYKPTQGDGIRWLWPNRDLVRRYGLLIMSYLLIAGIFLLVLRVASSWFLTTCCVLFPLLAGTLWWLILIKDTPPKAVAACISSISKSKIVSTRVTGRWSYRTRYAIAFAGFLAIVSVLPAVGFFKIAHSFEMRLMVKHGQVSLARAIEERTQRVAARYSSIKIGAKDGQGQSSSLTLEEKDDLIKQRLEWPAGDSTLGVYDKCFFDTKRINAFDAALQAPLNDDAAGPLECLLLEVRPLYNQSCVESQGLSNAASSDDQWRWKRDSKGGIFLWKDKVGRAGEASIALSSSIPAIAPPNTFWGWLRVVLSTTLIVLLPYGLVRFVARRFFLLDLDLPPRIDLPSATDRVDNYVLLRPPLTANPYKWDLKKYWVIDVRSEKFGPKWSKGIASKSAGLTVVLNNFEHRMKDPAANRQKLLAIEHLLKSDRHVVVVSTDCPFSFSLEPKPAGEIVTNNGDLKPPDSHAVLAGGTNGAADLKIEYHSSVPFSVAVGGKQNAAASPNGEGGDAELLQVDAQVRWTEMFTNFVTICAGDNPTVESVEDTSDFARILKTKAPWRYITPIKNWIGFVQDGTLQNPGDRAKVEELISEVVEQAQPYHQALWNTCSEGQRCTLIQLAQDGMLGPKNKHLRRLVKRGLIVLDPGLRLMDESFRRFVKSVSREEDVEGWRKQDGGSTWQLLRAPLLLILVGVALFLFVTQKDVYDSTISFMSAATAGIAALFRLLGMFNSKDKGAGAIQN